MAYLKEIPRDTCRCGKKAKVILVNKYNAEMGRYCKKCGNKELKEVGKRESGS